MCEPSIKKTAFNCPHCGVYTTQYWHNTYIKFIDEKPRVPFIPANGIEERIDSTSELDDKTKAKFKEQFQKIKSGMLFTDDESDSGDKSVLRNLYVSQCYNCNKWAVWVYENLVYPPKKHGNLPNQDLPSEVLAVVEEARQILDYSPKGAAALLRLSIQMLCKHLGKPGKDLNKDIALLVEEGLDPVVQKSLDVVRVIGNESVHPGTIDLSDDKDTASQLFDLINIICDFMITRPKNVNELYRKLPKSKREAIERRDGNKKEQ